MKSIAAEAGVSVMTVSLSLRDHPRISPETKARVREVADRLRYRTNPMVASLMAQIRSSRPVAYQATLALLVDDPQAWQKHLLYQSIREGIIERAGKLGFLIDTFGFAEPGMSRGRIEQVLQVRNIQGVIFSPLTKAGAIEGFDSSRWSVVALGNSVLSPRFHRVTHHQYHGMQLILDNLTCKGYRRIGLAIEPEVDDKVDRCWSACMTGYQMHIPAKDRVPIHLAKLDSESLQAWLKKGRPEVVIGHEGLYLQIEGLGLRVPEDLAYACVSVPSDRHPSFSGLNQNWKLVGAAAVDSVVAQIYRNEQGIPENPKTIMLEGFWVEGTTAPGL